MEISPISQELIDGLYYWDKIGPNWYRLIERANRDVLGHYLREDNWRTTRWIAVTHARYSYANGKSDQRGYTTEAEAKRAIEQHAKDVWID